jgi:hypothetical protein
VVEPLIRVDAGAAPVLAADGGSAAPAADGGSTAPSDDGGSTRAPASADPGRTPAADGGKPACRFDPLQPDAGWQGDAAGASDALPLPSDLFAFGGDEHAGFWALAGDDSAQLIHLDATGAALSRDDLGAPSDSVRFAPHAEPVIAATFERQVIALAGVSVGDPMKRGVFVVRRTAGAFVLLTQLEWAGAAPAPLPLQVVATPDGGAYVLVQLHGQGSLAPASAETQYAAADDAYSNVVVGVDASGRVSFIKPVPELETANAIALGANANVLVVGDAELQLWDRSGALLSQVALPSLGYGQPPLLQTDGAGDVYVALTFQQPLRVGQQMFFPHGGTSDILLLEYAPDGTLGWSKQLGDNAAEYLRAFELDAQGNLLLTGGFVGRTDLGNGAIDSEPPRDPSAAFEATDAFVVELAPDGTVLASARYGGDLGDESLAVIPIDADRVWLCSLRMGSDASISAQLVRVRLDGAATMHTPADLHEPFTRIAGAAGFGARLAASDDGVLVGSTLTWLQLDGGELAVRDTLERPSDAPPWFGDALAITHDLIAVGGAPEPDSSLSYALPPGVVYVYERDGDHFVRSSQLQVPGPPPAGFGHALAIVAGSVFVSAMDGLVYVFERGGAGWRTTQQLTAPGPGVLQNFGWAMAAQGDDLVVAHPGYQTPDNHAGTIYIYRRSAGAWQVHEQLTHPLAPLAHVDCHERGCTPVTHFGFGTQLAADADHLVATLGAVPLISAFARSGDMNHELQLIGDPSVADVDQQMRFGSACDESCQTRSLSVRRPFLALGDPTTTFGTFGAAGAATVYQDVGDRWFERGQAHSGAPRELGEVGMSVALYANGLAIGAPGEGDRGGGAVFDLPLTAALCQ